ncbi:MAG: hypothetical protein Q8P18_01540 [Pseudomonadota bacterium]|nr:hypothetical protein [Pseudomonadota bacterium]
MTGPPSRDPVQLRALFPREHGLWCWAGAPLLGAALLSPTLATGLGASAVLAFFGAGNAARKSAWIEAGWATVGGCLAGIAVLALVPAPGVWILTLAALVACGGIALAIADGATGRRVPAITLFELAAIGGFAATGAGLTVAGGVSPTTAVLIALCIATWEVIGLWWVRGQLARVLPGRTPWAAGPRAIGALAALLAAVAVAAGHPLLALLPALYVVRVAATRPATAPRDARRIGLGEAAWAVGATVLAVGGVVS